MESQTVAPPAETPPGPPPSSTPPLMQIQVKQPSSSQPEGEVQQVRIAVSHLNFYYGRFHALKDIHLDILDRQVTALIGPSGCGKSTFLRTLNRMNDLIPNTHLEGKVLFDGEDIYARNVDVVNLRKRIGMVFQRPNPFPMSIWDNVAYGPKLHGERH